MYKLYISAQVSIQILVLKNNGPKFVMRLLCRQIIDVYYGGFCQLCVNFDSLL